MQVVDEFLHLILEHTLVTLNALYQVLQSSHAINEGPCAYLAGHSRMWLVLWDVYLDFPQLLKDLVH